MYIQLDITDMSAVEVVARIPEFEAARGYVRELLKRVVRDM